jgi:hypothetical protein
MTLDLTFRATQVVAMNAPVQVVTVAAGPAASPYGACCQCNYRCMGIIGVVRGPPPRTWRGQWWANSQSL